MQSGPKSMTVLKMLKTLCRGFAVAGCICSSAVMEPALSAPSTHAGATDRTPAQIVSVASDGPVLKPDDPAAKPRSPLSRPDPGVPPATRGGANLADKTLDDLFQDLRSAKTEDEARPIDAMIQSRLMQSGSATVDLLMDRALLAVQGENMPLALDLLDSAIALKPDYAEGWNKRATLYFLSHDYGKAISDVEMVLRLEPRHYHALIGLASILNELGDKKHALAALRQVLVFYPTNGEVAKDVADLEAALDGKSL